MGSMSVQMGGAGPLPAKTDPHGFYSVSNLPSSAHSCTLIVSGPTGHCYRGGFLIFSDCSFGSNQDMRINVTLSEADDPKLAIYWPDGRMTQTEAIGYHVPPVVVSGAVECVAHGPGGRYLRRPVTGIVIKVVDQKGNQVADAVSDKDGKYHLDFTPKCPNGQRLKVILDPVQTGYQGGLIEKWGRCVYWTVYPKYPPTFVVSQCIRDDAFRGRAKALTGVTFPESKTFDCTKPPPEGSQGLPPCPAVNDACISTETKAR